MDDEENDLGDAPPPLIRRVDKFAEVELPGSKSPKPTPTNETGESNDEPLEEGETVERTFITVEQERGIKHMPSQQWRLRRENNTFKKPAGLPPLMSVRAEFDRNTDNLIASLGENAKFHNDEARNRFQERLGRLGRQNNNQNNNNGRNGDRNHRNQNRNRGQFGGKPHVASFNPTRDRYQPPNRNGGPINDLRPLLSGPNQWHGDLPFGGLSHVGEFSNSLARCGQDSDAVQNALRRHQLQQQGQPGLLGPGPNCLPEMAPLANALVSHLSTLKNFAPKYDMKIQKEIHEIQGKKMLYGASGVVSTDGPGIEEERFKPVQTDLSMNMRFSSFVVEN